MRWASMNLRGLFFSFWRVGVLNFEFPIVLSKFAQGSYHVLQVSNVFPIALTLSHIIWGKFCSRNLCEQPKRRRLQHVCCVTWLSYIVVVQSMMPITKENKLLRSHTTSIILAPTSFSNSCGIVFMAWCISEIGLAYTKVICKVRQRRHRNQLFGVT
jgi:hypothetical protein